MNGEFKDGLVTARLFGKVTDIELDRSGRPGSPAVLAVPHGGLLRDPHLLVVTDDYRLTPQGRLLVCDRHLVVADQRAQEPRELADVLVVSRADGRDGVAERLAATLASHPGAGLALGAFPGGCLAAGRDGIGLDIADAAGHATSEESCPPLLGSLLHCWLTALIPLEELESMALLVGALSGSGGRLAVAGRVRVAVTRTRKAA